jgi:hypothetical protein
MSEDEKFFYVSHIVPRELPNNGFTKLSFYIKKGDKYYRVLDNTSLSEEDIKNLEDTKKVIKLPKLLQIEKEKRKGLWADSQGKVYIADIANPYCEEKLNALEDIILK